MNIKRATTLFASTTLMAVVLTACGGGGDGVNDPETPAKVPASVNKSSSNMATFLADLSSDSPETQQMLDAETFMPPLTETAEPEPVN